LAGTDEQAVTIPLPGELRKRQPVEANVSAIAALGALARRLTRSNEICIDLASGTLELHIDDTTQFEDVGQRARDAFDAETGVATTTLESGDILRLELRAEEGVLRLERRREDDPSGWTQAAARQFAELLRVSLDSPSERIDAVPLAENRDGAIPDPAARLSESRHEPLPRLLEATASASPDRPALADQDRDWSYAEFWTSAARIASALTERGIRAGDRVAVTGRRSFGLVSALAGVLTSGAVVVPIDPLLPAQRRRLMLDEARAQIIVAAGTADDAGSGLDILEVGEDGRCPGSIPDRLPAIRHDQDAYVFFTSGTTGTPRAVIGRHGALSHFLAWQQRTFAIGPDDRAAQLTSLSFDVVLRDVFVALISGATLHLPPDGTTDGTAVLGWLRDEGITLVHLVPTLVRKWLAEAPENMPLPDLRLSFFAGEPLNDALVRSWRRRIGAEGTIVNLYGPTETTLAKFAYVVSREPAPGVQPVGFPLPETQALVVDGRDSLCDVGEPGEILIRTPFRTRGYANAPEEHARRFVRNPFSDDPTDVVYRSGDLGRYRPDGGLDVLGRLDDQIKIRGVRVEPGEVQTLLERDPRVRQAAVVGDGSASGEPRLVAYVVAAEGAGPEIVSELRRAIAQALPGAAVPGAFVMLDALPVTANGKLDHRALPEPEVVASTEAGALDDPTEESIAAIWEAVLGASPGPADDFFDVGGDSLAAIQVAALLQREFGKACPIDEIYTRPTVAELAEFFREPAQAPRQR
jgi:amino acid adenylation domain-containing protein